MNSDCGSPPRAEVVSSIDDSTGQHLLETEMLDEGPQWMSTDLPIEIADANCYTTILEGLTSSGIFCPDIMVGYVTCHLCAGKVLAKSRVVHFVAECFPVNSLIFEGGAALRSFPFSPESEQEKEIARIEIWSKHDECEGSCWRKRAYLPPENGWSESYVDLLMVFDCDHHPALGMGESSMVGDCRGDDLLTVSYDSHGSNRSGPSWFEYFEDTLYHAPYPDLEWQVSKRNEILEQWGDDGMYIPDALHAHELAILVWKTMTESERVASYIQMKEAALRRHVGALSLLPLARGLVLRTLPAITTPVCKRNESNDT
jgi:hypothetical protein